MMVVAAQKEFKDPYRHRKRPKKHRKAVGDMRRLINEAGWNELKMQDAIQTLRSFSLVSTTTIADSLFLRLHPLVQAWLRDMDLPNAPDYRTMAHQILASCHRRDHLQLCRYLTPHINAFQSDNEGQRLHDNDQVAAGKVLRELGQYRLAEELLSRALTSLRHYYKKDTWKTLFVAMDLAATIFDQGRWAEAEQMDLETLEKQIKIYGVKHPMVLQTVGNLAAAYALQSRYKEAEKMQLFVLKQRKRMRGLEHRKTILAMSSLAVTYSYQRRFS